MADSAEPDAGSIVAHAGEATAPVSIDDRRLPDGRRRITACGTCRKLKIKCHMPGASAPCARCKRRGLACSVNRPLQMLLDDDSEWKQTVTRKIQELEATVDSLSRKLHNGGASSADDGQGPNRDQEHDQAYAAGSIHVVPLHVSSGSTHEAITMDVDSGLATIPASSINGTDPGKDTTTDYGRGAVRPGDIISDGIVTRAQAEVLFNDYVRLDHYLYRILGLSVTLDEIRSSSPVLLAAVCTVAALHSVELSFLYEPCYQRFANLAANLTLAEYSNLDDIRSLCIGAFWLHKLSWNLSSLAVRIATQKHLHRAFRSALKGKKDYHFAQIRLWYHVYVCDHQFSIVYGRPPLTHDYEISRAKEILVLPQATEDDARLVAQAELWSTASKVFETFGFEADQTPPASLVGPMRRFAIEYDTWRADYNDRFKRHVHVANYPRKGVKLHVDFQKLYLCSHAFRGLNPSPVQPREVLTSPSSGRLTNPMSQTPSIQGRAAAQAENESVLNPDLEEIAATAVQSARSILETIISDPEIQAHLNGLPLYFNTMVAFAIVFLFKIATKYSHVITIDIDRTLKLVARVADILKAVTADMSPRHLLVSISKAVETLPATRSRDHEHESNLFQAMGSNPPSVLTPLRLPPPLDARDPRASTFDGGWADPNWDMGVDFDWMTYDFLGSDNAFVEPDLQDLEENQGNLLG